MRVPVAWPTISLLQRNAVRHGRTTVLFTNFSYRPEVSMEGTPAFSCQLFGAQPRKLTGVCPPQVTSFEA
jgi:hypothetical protein